MEPRTHRAIDPSLCGRVVTLAEGRAEVALAARDDMAADERGLVHGGFVFGLADYAAMLAVNEETVVLASATLEFKAPVVVGDELRALATLTRSEGKKRFVDVAVLRRGQVVLEVQLVCVVPSRHVLER